ncbi:hypothetical protein [Thermocoleostomius sinensis]|uniref:Uncharacterized protein n=1 Tax=Thermocoleostomius sinensis A174 TaxID=2016057 RepID=A0A9E8ZF51_9CYAN|nr:hypothetical protein [Thermocoleostomius sinensis]WAL60672.1 hypothetical protein OXH18_01345 [Thermocoleostomius sinensis A174]
MAYSDFTLASVKTTLDLNVDESQSLFQSVERVQPSEFLTVALQDYLPLATAINTILGILLQPF